MAGRLTFQMFSRAIAVGWLVAAGWIGPSEAQDASLVLSNGGVRFADGTVQTTAAVTDPVLRATGLTLCYDATGAQRSCVGTGEDGELQIGAAPPATRFTDRGDGTVLDSFTGLIWLKDADCPGAKKTWQEALDWVASLNSSFIGCADYAAQTYTDWRLPNPRELAAVTDLTAWAPALTPGHPFVNLHGQIDDAYWSSTTTFIFLTETRAFILDAGTGTIRHALKTETWWVWPVRGGQ